jgi:recombination protein RecT
MDNTQVTVQQKNATLGELMHSPAVVGKLNEVWSSPQMANSFMSSVISVANGNPQLRKAEPMSIIGAAMVAATMQLQVIPTLGQCYIIPYGSKAQFQVGYLGLLQLCQRSGQFKKILAAPVHEGEYISGDEFDEDYVFDKKQRKSDKIVGYMAKFELLNGFTKVAYWDVDRVKAHATKFSQAYRSGYTSPWKSDFDAMAQKTVLKSILKYAPKSIEMQNAVTFDQAVVNVNSSDIQDLDIDAFAPEYIDNLESEKKENIAAKAAETAVANAAKKETKA